MQFVCTGGTSSRMKNFVHYLADVLDYKIPLGTAISEITNYRFSMYKVGPVLAVSVSWIDENKWPVEEVGCAFLDGSEFVAYDCQKIFGKSGWQVEMANKDDILRKHTLVSHWNSFKENS